MKKIMIAFMMMLATASLFAQSYKDFNYVFKRGQFDAAMFERGIRGAETIPADKVAMLSDLIQKGYVALYPNRNKVVWYADAVRDIMSREGGKDFFEIMTVVCAIYCGNYGGEYLYWVECWLTTDKKFAEYTLGKYYVYNVW